MATTTVNTRESSFELIRVLAQWFIVLYHILSVIVYKSTEIAFYKAVWLPLHIGVPLFVMISGYFGIKTDVKRLVKLVGMVLVLQVPLLIVDTIIGGGTFRDYLSIMFFISNTPFWFVRTYICLFLFAPVINNYLNICTLRERILLLASLFFITIYIGTLRTDPSLIDGKNLVSFIFYYVVGNTLKVYKNKWQSIPRKYLLFLFITVNVLLVTLFSYYGNNRLVDAVYMRLFFSYNSVGLLLNSIIFFMMIGGLTIRSNFINHIGKSSLAIYLLHGTPLVIYRLLPPIIMWFYLQMNASIPLVMLSLIVISGIIVIVCWLIYELLHPIWLLVDKASGLIQETFNRLFARLINE